MGEKLEIERFYIQSEDGKLIPFAGITSAQTDIWIGDKMDEETYASLVHEGTISCTIIQTHKQARRTAKMLNSIINCHRRRMRTLKRRKEKERRNGLRAKNTLYYRKEDQGV